MAENKKSFVLYADLLRSIEHLTNEEKGILFNHLLEYVNDKNPVLEDRLILTAWKPIELQLKRDLIKFEEVKAKRSDAGKRSAELRAIKAEEQNSTNPTHVESVEQTSTNPTVNDNDTVNVNDNVILLKKETKVNISDRKLSFYNSLIPYTQTYGKVMLREFYEYWTEHGENDLKFRKEKEKTFGLERRLKTWSTNNFNNKTELQKNIPNPSKRKEF